MQIDEEKNKINEASSVSPDGLSRDDRTTQQVEQIQSSVIQNPRRIFKIIVIGDSNVGKTCLSFRFCGEKTIQIDDEIIKLQIWDTAGQERFRKSMISHYYRNVHAVLFVYDVTNIHSFENLTHWIDEYNRFCSQSQPSLEIPRILVGNKCDLDLDQKVSTNMAQTFADMHQMPLFETSAKDDSRSDHVEAIFMTLALKLKNSRPFYVPNKIHRAKVQSVDHSNSADVSNNSCYLYNEIIKEPLK
ncbi:Ras-related Rab-33 [Brachionus plicatilis]|uniref:Ras-related Rab-33 n=1 Tax=Brachionus plicatilis TaxID=10195 RepID=A0A3M7RAN9_BRAPC|nr:Ras-related Rab-33 [Brachionus plicatilis]